MNNNKRIIHVAQANGGVECYLKMFFKYWKKGSYENYLILSYQYKDSVSYFEEIGVKVFLVDMKRNISPISDFKSMIDIFKIIKNIKADIVYSHSTKAGGIARIPAKLCGAKVIYNPHGWAFDMDLSKKKKGLFILIERILGLITNTVVAISDYEKKIAIENNIIRKKDIIVIENAIDLEIENDKFNAEELLLEIGWSKENKIIGIVARISEQKSPKTFIDIAEKVLKKLPEARFIMVGDGEQRTIIEQIIEKKGIKDKIYITGWIDDVQKYINIFDIALLTSKWEGFGLVIPEYMLLRKPVIASNVGGIANIIENKRNGILIDNLNAEKFAEAILMILKDENIKDTIVDNAYDLVIEKYDFNRVIKEHEKMFKEL